MGYTIRVDPEELAATVGNFEALRTEIESSVQRMQGVVLALDGTWMGNAYQQYNATMTAWNQDANRILQDLQTLNTLVRQGIANFEQTDSAAASAFGSAAS
jgi:WXG100 family type VII secretion target